MSNNITLRPAQAADAELLLEWRNDAETRSASHSSGAVSPTEHKQWLERQLKNPAMRLFIAESGGSAVGTVRAAATDGIWELSWTVAPGARGQGHAKAMVAALADDIDAPIRAEIKAGNMASVKVAEHAGMSFEQQHGDVLHYARAARPKAQS